MRDDSTVDALPVLATAVDQDHDSLAAFTRSLNDLEGLPAFWWGEDPVWVTEEDADFGVWPLRKVARDKIEISSLRGPHRYVFDSSVLLRCANAGLERPLSAAEFATFVDVSAGLSLEQSADDAGLAVSTRRKQVQSTFRKTGALGQTELVSRASRIAQGLAAQCDAVFDPDARGWGAYRQFLPEGVRFGVTESAGRKPVRYLDMGPASGQPVMMLHPMIFPHLDAADVAFCHDHGLRMIWPVRSGCLSTTGHRSSGWDPHRDRVVQDMHTVHRAVTDDPVPVVALVSSGAYATAYAQTHPRCVSRIDFVSTCFSAGKTASRDVYFGDFLLRNLRGNGRMALVMIQHLVGTVFSTGQLERSLRRVFKGSATDQALLDAEFATETGRDRVTFAIRHSIEAMRLDYLSQVHFSWSDARAVPVPKTFWHGAQDAVHELDTLAALARRVTGSPVRVLPDMGHLTQGPPLREAMRQISTQYSK